MVLVLVACGPVLQPLSEDATVRDFCVHVPLKECPAKMGLTVDYNPLSYEMWGSTQSVC